MTTTLAPSAQEGPSALQTPPPEISCSSETPESSESSESSARLGESKGNPVGQPVQAWTLGIRFEQDRVSTRGAKGTDVEASLAQLSRVFRQAVCIAVANQGDGGVSAAPSMQINGEISIVINGPRPELPTVKGKERTRLRTLTCIDLVDVPTAKVAPPRPTLPPIVPLRQPEPSEPADPVEPVEPVEPSALATPLPPLGVGDLPDLPDMAVMQCSNCDDVWFDYCPGCGAYYCSRLTCISDAESLRSCPPQYHPGGFTVQTVCRACKTRQTFSVSGRAPLPAEESAVFPAEAPLPSTAKKRKAPLVEVDRPHFPFVCNGANDPHCFDSPRTHTRSYATAGTILSAFEHASEFHEANIQLRTMPGPLRAPPQYACITGACASSPFLLGALEPVNRNDHRAAVPHSLEREIHAMNHMFEEHGVSCIRLTLQLRRIPEVAALVSNPDAVHIPRYSQTLRRRSKRAKTQDSGSAVAVQPATKQA